MAHSRRLPQRRTSSSVNSSTTTRTKTLRRGASRFESDASAEFISSPLPHGHRLPLFPLQGNLRRLPSRFRVATKGELNLQMREPCHVTVGSKRKLFTSGNENSLTHGRGLRSSKRRKTTTEIRSFSSTSEESLSENEMEVDNSTTVGTHSDSSQEDEEPEFDQVDEEADDSSDDFFLNFASPKRLNKLLKKKLVELYTLTGLTEPIDSLKKSEIIEAITNARDDAPVAPPSSSGRTDCASSEYLSSDDGNIAEDETDAPHDFRPSPNNRQLRRAITLDMSKTPRPKNTVRSVSMGNLLGPFDSNSSQMNTKFRRRISVQSSPNTSPRIQHLPVTRLRSRQVSGSLLDVASPPSSVRSKGKGKSKQVEFSKNVEVFVQAPSKRGKKKESSSTSERESKRSDDTKVQQQLSPRRLRSKTRESDLPDTKEDDDSQTTPVSASRRKASTRKTESEADNQVKRKLPMRQAKIKFGNLQDSQDEEGASQHDEEEVDELVSSASLSPTPESHERRIPPRRRALRPRPRRVKTIPTVDEDNEGDDEDDAEEDVETQDGDRGDEESEEDEEQREEEEAEDEIEIALEPKKLRSGKVVGEEREEEEEEEEEDGEEGEEEGEEEEGQGEEDDEQDEIMEVDQDSVDMEDDDNEIADEAESAEGSDQEPEEVMEEDVDLTIATAKMLVRLRRDDLVRLCESREIEPAGTKPQLAEALLQWRDQQATDLSSPSSSGTVRPSSPRRNRRTKTDSDMTTTTDVPVLLRSHYVHIDEPITPNPEKGNEELDLDLESLGLEDREIPVEKLTKLEKIGSGGFKDVFIGKFKGRKVAISEFRGQLSAMDIKELKLLGAFHHNNIVRFVGVSIPENTKESPVMIISELCSNGDLFDYIRNEKPASLHKVLKLMLDIARGLEYLHTRTPSIIHRDCKSSNILITAKGVAKIADFGLAKVKQSTKSMVRSLVGTVNWQAPELWTAHPRYDHKVDVFSCAMVFWEMLQWHLPDKKFPWEGMNEHAIYEAVGAKKQRPSISGLKKQWCSEIIELIEHMWSQEPQDRPSITEVVESLEDLFTKY